MARCEECIYKSHYREMGWSADVCTRGKHDLATAIEMCDKPEPCKWHITAEQCIAIQESTLKSKVANEVLDEAIRIVYSKTDTKIYNTIDGKPLGDHVAYGKQMAMYDVITLLAELKKKYTEGKE